VYADMQSILLVQTTLRMLTREEYPVNDSETLAQGHLFLSLRKRTQCSGDLHNIKTRSTAEA